MSKLIKRFFSYPLSQYQKKNKMSTMEFIDFNDLDLNTVIRMVAVGNSHKMPQGGWVLVTEEEAADILDEFLAADESHSVLDAYLICLDAFDKHIHLFSRFGVRVSDIKAQLEAKINEGKSKLTGEATESETADGDADTESIVNDGEAENIEAEAET